MGETNNDQQFDHDPAQTSTSALQKNKRYLPSLEEATRGLVSFFLNKTVWYIIVPLFGGWASYNFFINPKLPLKITVTVQNKGDEPIEGVKVLIGDKRENSLTDSSGRVEINTDARKLEKEISILCYHDDYEAKEIVEEIPKNRKIELTPVFKLNKLGYLKIYNPHDNDMITQGF